METKQYLFQAHQVVVFIQFPTILGSGANTFTGSAGDSFTTNLAAGITNAVTYKLDFNPISLRLKYNPSTTATASSLSNEEFVIKSDINKTITVLNPSNQLLMTRIMMGSMKVVSLFILLLKFDLD
jgi:hypothetical protein